MIGLAALLVACRGAPLGTAVADDYSFLFHERFHRLDPFDSMGAAFYWRPVSRQLYFGLLAPWLLAAPWAAALVNAALLVATAALLERVLRARTGPWVAALAALAVLLSEPARVLLGWPSGAQHLIAGCAAVVAIHEAQRGRLATAGLAALAGVLSHESAVLVIPLLPILAWRRSKPEAVRALVVSVAVIAVWAAGYVVAIRHGVLLPRGGEPGAATEPAATQQPAESHAPIAARVVRSLPTAYARAVPAALDLEDVHGAVRGVVLFVDVALVILALIASSSEATRRRMRQAFPVVVVGVLWFVLGVVPLAALLPDWNAWRAWTPTLGLTTAVLVLLGVASPWLAGTWVALRLVALLAAPVAPALVPENPPRNGSHVSFTQLVRLQKIVDGTREALLDRYRRLPQGGAVAYWIMPRLAEFGFQGSRALQVWYGDSTLAWSRFGGLRGLDRTFVAGVEYRYGHRDFAAALSREPLELFQRAGREATAGDYAKSDSLLDESQRSLHGYSGPFLGSIFLNRGVNAYNRGDRAAAESLWVRSGELGPETATYWVLGAALAMDRGERAVAVEAIRAALAQDPNDPDALRLAQRLLPTTR